MSFYYSRLANEMYPLSESPVGLDTIYGNTISWENVLMFLFEDVGWEEQGVDIFEWFDCADDDFDCLQSKVAKAGKHVIDELTEDTASGKLYRCLDVSSISDIVTHSLGPHWSTSRKAAFDFCAHHRETSSPLLLVASPDFHEDIDWEQTIAKRLVGTFGSQEQEVYMGVATPIKAEVYKGNEHLGSVEGLSF